MLQSPGSFLQLLKGAVTCWILASHSDKPFSSDVDEQKMGKFFKPGI
jgi:hypothetical protein